MYTEALIKELKSGLPANSVLFFVEVPLCLGVALVSGAPFFAGIASGSPLGLSYLVAGLVVILFAAIEAPSSWPASGY